MTERSTEDLVQQLARDLPPVKPIARLRVAVSAVVGLWFAAVVVTVLAAGELPRVGEADFWSNPVTVAILLGLATAAGGAVVAGLASAIPGRESLVRAGQIEALVAAVWLVGWGLWAAVGSAHEPLASLLVGSGICLGHGFAFAIPAALAACIYLSRGAPQHRKIASAGVAAGAAGLGALAVHTLCDVAGGFHVLLGHCLTPILAALLFAVPLAGLTRRWARTEIEA
jgi:hypothetical protein